MRDHSAEQRGAIYLDVDGVIIADEPPFQDAREVLLDGKTSDTVGHAIGKSGLELVWLTTWENSILEFAAEKFDTGLRNGRALNRTIEDRKIGRKGLVWKANALIHDQADSPCPFVWVDDDITQRVKTEVLRHCHSTPSLIIVPDKTTGLHAYHLDEIKEFAENL